MIQFLSNLWPPLSGGSSDGLDDVQDGYGQSWRDDARSMLRFRALRRQLLTWRPPGDWPGDIGGDFPILDRFGDGVVAWRREGDEDWFVIYRVWHGWPDPPEFAFFAFDAQKQIVTACDFHAWPDSWTMS